MKAWIDCCDGRSWGLPAILSWDIYHGFGSPCDSFEVEFLHSQELIDILPLATGFRAEYGGENVFKGRVDEFSCTASADGCLCTLRGRGLQALMLDNEAESADYYNADMDYILSRHAREIGINDIAGGGCGGSAAVFTVESGMSHWGVVAEFADFCCGVKPRFSPEGVLILDGEHQGRRYKLDGGTPVSRMEYREDRSGVISSVKVKKYSSGGSITVENQPFLEVGGRCGRVVNVPKKTGYDAMRYTGQYQIRRSAEDWKKCFVTIPQAFAAFAGDIVEISRSPLGLTGEFLVVGSRCIGGSDGVFTRLDMRRI